ncbi:MAG TPA: hypothetical protein VGX16_00775, partial [Solirubrobacteraceae bacterium]|nr:hypothetical protein [Solirubrobacteraceae bacterium]
YPQGAGSVTVLAREPTPSLCNGSPAEISTRVLGALAEHVYRGELSGANARAALRTAERSRRFTTAVARGDATQARGAIVEFFRNHSHVVRVRVTRGGKLLIDLGGPLVLAPVSGELRGPRGRVYGRFELSVQDDVGYVLLAHEFTGGEVFLRGASGQVLGTLSPGPASIPDRGPVTYGGVRYQAYSFMGEAFPSGPLRISLLVREG